MNSTVSKPTQDAGFTLIELVMAIVVLFIALAASTQIIVSMVAATVAQRHIDLATSVATDAMETAVAYDCGGQLLAPSWADGATETATDGPIHTFYSNLQSRCKVAVDTPVGVTPVCPAQTTSPPSATDGATDAVFNRGWAPVADQTQTDLGSRRFVVYKKATSFDHSASGSVNSGGGRLAVCTTIRLSWKYIKTTGAASKPDDGTNDSLRLQRRVHVQWSEPNQTRVRSRDLVQLSALPPDSKVAVNLGRISVATGVGGSATLRVPITNQSLTLVADDDATSGIVNFPFLADGTYTISRPGSAVDRTIVLNASSRSQCWLTGGNVVSFDRTTCHG